MPLKEGSNQETISSNIKETLESGTFARGKSKKKRRKMASAAAYRKARKSLSKTALQK